MFDFFAKLKNIFKNKKYEKIDTRMMAGTGISAPWNYPQYGSGAKYTGGLSRSSPINIHSHFELRQQIRDKLYDSLEARSLVTSKIDVVVDIGLRLKPVPIADILGIEPEAAEQWAENVAQGFHLWAKSNKSDRRRINNFYQNQQLYQLFFQRDSDIFVRFFYGRDKDQLNPLQIGFIDPNQIRGYDYTNTYYQFPHDDGIIFDKNGREKSYKIWHMKENFEYEYAIVPAIGEKSGRIFMKHAFSPEYAGQTRGMPKLTHLIQELEDLTGFKLSVLQKAINQASFVGAVENDEQDASNPLVGRVAGPVRDYGTAADIQAAENENASLEGNAPINWTAMPEATLDRPGSVLIGNLRRGDKFKYLQDTSPSEGYASFESAFFTSICASTGWASEVVLKKFSNNYSASRGILILIWRKAQIEKEDMASDFLDPIYEMWLSEEIAAGRIKAPGWSDPRMRAAWLNCEWAGAPMPNIDPLKTMEADRGYVEIGAQTLDDVARNLNGSSGKANRAKNTRQYEELPNPPWPIKPIDTAISGGNANE